MSKIETSNECPECGSTDFMFVHEIFAHGPANATFVDGHLECYEESGSDGEREDRSIVCNGCDQKYNM